MGSVENDGSSKTEAPASPFSTEDIAYIQNTWRGIAAEPLEYGRHIFRRLFEQHPEIMKKFYFAARNQCDIEKTMEDEKLINHAQGVVGAVTAATNSLTRLDLLVPILLGLGGKHAKFNPEREHFQAVGEALMWVLGRHLGAQLTDDGHALWLRVYGVVTATMLDGITQEKEKTKTTKNMPDIV